MHLRRQACLPPWNGLTSEFIRAVAGSFFLKDTEEPRTGVRQKGATGTPPRCHDVPQWAVSTGLASLACPFLVKHRGEDKVGMGCRSAAVNKLVQHLHAWCQHAEATRPCLSLPLSVHVSFSPSLSILSLPLSVHLTLHSTLPTPLLLENEKIFSPARFSRARPAHSLMHGVKHACVYLPRE